MDPSGVYRESQLFGGVIILLETCLVCGYEMSSNAPNILAGALCA